MARDESGFTLLEVLVAFIIAGLALAVLFRGAIEGVRGTRLSAHYQDALARAQSRMASFGRDIPLVDSDRQGDDGGGFHWRTRITTTATAPLSRVSVAHGPGVALHAIEIVISWQTDGGNRRVVLQTERTGFAAPAAP
jgi:general secretion pathway protein I